MATMVTVTWSEEVTYEVDIDLDEAKDELVKEDYPVTPNGLLEWLSDDLNRIAGWDSDYVGNEDRRMESAQVKS
jgi:hypothetical protein